jgi:hypothetical protein
VPSVACSSSASSCRWRAERRYYLPRLIPAGGRQPRCRCRQRRTRRRRSSGGNAAAGQGRPCRLPPLERRRSRVGAPARGLRQCGDGAPVLSATADRTRPSREVAPSPASFGSARRLVNTLRGTISLRVVSWSVAVQTGGKPCNALATPSTRWPDPEVSANEGAEARSERKRLWLDRERVHPDRSFVRPRRVESTLNESGRCKPSPTLG